MEVKKIVYPNLKAEMARHGETSAILGELLNISQVSVRRKLSGNKEWKINEIVTICDHYKMGFEELFKRV
jgi:hypothetical protein